MSSEVPHEYQWLHTENAISVFSELLETCRNNKDHLEDIFLKPGVCATEKFDGTNVAKDEDGHIYGRRMIISEDKNFYQKTPLDAVKSANVGKVKKEILNLAKMKENNVKQFFLYGELICNHLYDYDERNLFGKWLVFGARVIGENEENIYNKLFENGFCVKRKKDCTLILPNATFLEIVKSSGIDVPNMIGNMKSVFDIVQENKDCQARGSLEGIILTWFSSQYGGHIVKWKGPHEPHPNAVKDIANTFKILQEEKIEGDLKKIFSYLKQVSETGSDINPHVREKKGKVKKGQNSDNKQKEKEKRSLLRNLTAEDKKLIVDGVYHSMKKFDDLKTYKKEAGGIDNFIKVMGDEVVKHYIEEKRLDEENFVENNTIIVEFIKDSVRKIVIKKAYPKPT